MSRRLQSDEEQALLIVQRALKESLIAPLRRSKSEADLLHASITMLANFYEDPGPIPLILTCIACGGRHVDTGVWATRRHHTHACQYCGVTWRPAVEDTVGVQFLPGFKEE